MALMSRVMDAGATSLAVCVGCEPGTFSMVAGKSRYRISRSSSGQRRKRHTLRTCHAVMWRRGWGPSSSLLSSCCVCELSEWGGGVCRSEHQYLPSMSGGAIFGLGRCVAECDGFRGGVACKDACRLARPSGVFRECFQMACGTRGWRVRR